MMSSVGEVELRMSTGIYSGTCHFSRRSSHRELVVAGPAATATIGLEDAAGAGEVLVSPATAAAVGARVDSPASVAAPPCSRSSSIPTLPRRLSSRRPPPRRPGVPDLEPFVPPALRAYLRLEGGEAEHRQVTAAFVKFTGVEALLAKGGPEALSEPLASSARPSAG